MENLEELDRISINKALKLYLQEVGCINDLQNLAGQYGLEYDSEKATIKPNTKLTHYQQRIKDLKADLIDEIQTKRESVHKVGSESIAKTNPPPELTPEQARTKLPRYDQSEEFKQNQELIKQQRAEIEAQQAIIEKNKQIIEALRKQIPNQVHDNKLKQLSEDDASKLREQEFKQDYNMRSNYLEEHKPQKPSYKPLDTDAPGVILAELDRNYGISDNFKKSHHGLTFNEFRKLNTGANEKLMNMIKYLNSDEQTDWHINFSQFNESSLKNLHPYLEKWFDEKISQLNFQEYMFHFKVGDCWYSKPMTEDIFDQLKESLVGGTLIYDMEKMPTFEYDVGGNKEFDLPEWSLFDEISISKIKKYNNVNRDNGGHFFKYLNNYTEVPAINDYFKRLQIFDTLCSPSGKTMRKELEDCCFIYALKQTGQFSEEELNLMRLRVKTRYLSTKAIKALCKEFHIKVIVHVIDLNDNGSRKKINNVRADGENFLGDPNATEDRTFEFNLFENHYFIEERTTITKDFINHIDTSSPENYISQFSCSMV